MQFRTGFKFLVIITIVISIVNPVLAWEKVYGSIYDEKIFSMQITYNNDFIMTGYQDQTAYGDRHLYLFKANSYGDSLWAKAYVTETFAYDLALTQDDGYISAGHISIDTHTLDYYLFKTDVNGDTLWTHSYGFDASQRDCSILPTSDGSYISMWWHDPSGHCIFVMKVDSIGDTIWTSIICRSHLWGHCIVDAKVQNYIIVGSSSPSGGEQDGYIVKIDSLGEMVWDTTYGGTGYNDLFYISPTDDSCYIITGFTTLYYSDYRDVYLLKINEDGDTLWTRKYGGYDYNDYGRCVKQTTDGGYIIAGYTYSYGIGTPDNSNVYLIKTDSLGNLEWQRTFGGMYEDRGYSVSQTDDGGYIIAGFYDHGPHTDVYLIKTDSLGYSVWVREIPIKPEDISLNVYPNPFNSSCRIEAPIGAEIEIFDLNGRVVNSWAGGLVEASGCPGSPDSRMFGSPVYSWQPDNNVTSGVYLVRASMGERKITKKVIYLK